MEQMHTREDGDLRTAARRDGPTESGITEDFYAADYAEFELRLKTAPEFKSKLLSRGEWVEVLDPKSLADEII